MKLTFLHSADWQLGKPFAGVDDLQKRALLQNERFAVIKRLARIAKEHGAEFVLVAGDLFDSPQATKATVAAACSAIGTIGVPVFAIPGNPPISTSQDLRNGQLQTLGTGLSSQGVPALITFQYNAQIPSSWQWQAGMQFALPYSTMLDVAYVGSYGFNRLRAFQGGANGAVDLNAVDIGAAYLPQNQDPTLGTSTVPGATAYPANLLRAFRGYSNINEQETRYWDEYHGLQFSLNRRFTRGSLGRKVHNWNSFMPSLRLSTRNVILSRRSLMAAANRL